MQASETILFSDLDGTLFDSQGRISQRNRDAIEKYIADGGKFAIATGRIPCNVLNLIGTLPTNAPSVALNGAEAYDFRTGAHIFTKYLNRETLDPLLQWALAEIPDVELQMYTASEIIYCTPEEKAQPTLLELHRPCRFTTYAAMLGQPIVKCLLYAPPAQEEKLATRLRECEAGNYHLTPGSVLIGERISYYELMPLDSDKGIALHSLRTHPDVIGRRVLAVGDYWNDYEMLREADVAIAPANAIPEIRQLCDEITTSNDEDAIARIIMSIIPNL